MIKVRILPVAALALGANLFSACSDVLAPDHREARIPAAPSLDLSGALRPRLFSDHLRDVAARAPGFSGVAVDEVGTVIVASTGQVLSPELREAVSDLFVRMNRRDLSHVPFRIRQVGFDYETLERFMGRLHPSLMTLDGVTAGGVEDHMGRIIVGVDQEATAGAVRRAARSLGIPEHALNVEVFGKTQDVIGLRDVHSTMRGGLAVAKATGTEWLCSIGFLGWMKDEYGQPEYSFRVMTTASHCTGDEIAVNGDVFGQPNSSRRIGVEVDEAVVYPTGHGYCAAVAPNRCRFADVAVLRLDDSVASAAGSVAKSSATSWPTNPPYMGAQAYVGGGVVGAVVGEVVTKVGAVTGQRTGQVTHNCLWRPSSSTPNLVTLCVQRVAAFTESGDSGGTVFIPYSAQNPTTPRAVGTVFQRDGSSGTYMNTVNGMNNALGNKYFYAW